MFATYALVPPWALYLARNYSSELIAEDVDTSQVKELQEKANTLAEKMGLKNPPQLMVIPNQSWSAIQMAYRNTSGIMTVNKKIFDPNKVEYYLKDSHHWTIAHELGHFYHHHSFRLQVIVTIISAAFIPLSLSFHFTHVIVWGVFEIIACLVTIISFVIFSRYQEKQADLHACRYTTDAEKLATITRFHFLLKSQLEYRNEKGISRWERWKRKIEIDPQGNYRLDWQHPPLTKRIRYIRETLKHKVEHFDPDAILRKSMRKEKNQPFEHWHKLQMCFDAEGKRLPQNSPILKAIKTACLYPFYYLRYQFPCREAANSCL